MIIRAVVVVTALRHVGFTADTARIFFRFFLEVPPSGSGYCGIKKPFNAYGMGLFVRLDPYYIRGPNPRKRGLSIPHPITSSFYHPFRYRGVDKPKLLFFLYFVNIFYSKKNSNCYRAYALDVHKNFVFVAPLHFPDVRLT